MSIIIQPINSTINITQINHLDRIDPHLAQANADAGRYLVAVDKHDVVGILKRSYFQDHLPYCVNLQVSGAYQGQGIGKRMMTHRHEMMADQGFTHTLISTNSGDWVLDRYKTLGYEEVGSLDLRSVLEWEDEVEVFLVKKL